MTTPRIAGLAAIALIVALAPAWSAPSGSRTPAATTSASAPSSVTRYSLPMGKSTIITSREDISRVSVGAKEVADFVLLSPRQVYVTGIAPGVTNLMLWGSGNRVIGVYDLDVAPDVTRLKKMLHDVLPGETGIEVRASQDSIALAGTVRDAESLKKALSLAEVYAPKKVVNLLSVGGVQQVMLEVRVAEMSKTLVNRMGINLNAVGDGSFAYTLIGGLSSLAPGMLNVDSVQNVYDYVTTTATSGSTSFESSPVQLRYREFNVPSNRETSYLNQGTAAARWSTNWGGAGNTTMTAVIDMLKQNGLVKILAEPNLVCLNGQTAKFLAGGEIPVPVPSGLGTTSIEWKEFGVGLKFTPSIVTGERISLQVNPEVSDLDYTRAIQINGFTIPAINTRRTSTTIELNNGQSFAVAGLLREESRNSMDKYPMLGDIPVLGNLFKSSQFQKDQSELVIIITAHLAKPLDKKHMAMPSDSSHEPDDLEFFLGIAGGGDGQKPASVAGLGHAGGSLDGDYGHAMPAAVTGRPAGAAGREQ